MIKVFTGPMYSAKSNSLIEEYNKIQNRKRKDSLLTSFTGLF